MTKVTVKYNNKKETIHTDSNLYARDAYNHKVSVSTWEKAMNYVNSFHCTGYNYYDTWEDALDSFNTTEELDGSINPNPEYTMEDIKKTVNPWQIGEDSSSDYYFEIEEDEE